MTKEEFRAIEGKLATGHAHMARLLGLSEVSVKRYATGAQVIPKHIETLTLALLLIDKENLQKKLGRMLAKYHTDT